jgi:hypothetical protein
MAARSSCTLIGRAPTCVDYSGAVQGGRLIALLAWCFGACVPDITVVNDDHRGGAAASSGAGAGTVAGAYGSQGGAPVLSTGGAADGGAGHSAGGHTTDGGGRSSTRHGTAGHPEIQMTGGSTLQAGETGEGAGGNAGDARGGADTAGATEAGGAGAGGLSTAGTRAAGGNTSGAGVGGAGAGGMNAGGAGTSGMNTGGAGMSGAGAGGVNAGASGAGRGGGVIGNCLTFADDFATLSTSAWTTSYSAGAVYTDHNMLLLATTPNTGCGSARAVGTITRSLADGTIVFEARAATFVDASTYGDHQPRGLVAGDDRSNAIEFVTSDPAPGHVACRTVANGVATETTFDTGSSVAALRLYRLVATKTQVTFFIDNVVAAVHTTNIPTTPLNAYFSTTDSCQDNAWVGVDYVSLSSCPNGVIDQKRAFLTNVHAPGNFGGIGPADGACQTEAQGMGLPGIYRAWLGDGTVENLPSSRFFQALNGYATLNGISIATSFSDLTNGTLTAPLNVDAAGITHTLEQAWTNVHVGSGPPIAASCDGWSSVDESDTGWTGKADSVTTEWSESQLLPCYSTRQAAIYCFEQ